MKNCPICHRHYTDQVQYCTRDGTKLISAVPFKNHCTVCNRYYPPGLECCPVHGIALKDADPSAIEPTAVEAAPESEPQAEPAGQEAVKSAELRADDLFPPAAITTPPEVAAPPHREQAIELEKVLRPAANTRELGPPPIPSATMSTMLQYSSAEYASADRRLIGIMAVLITLVIGGLAAYGLTRPTRQTRVTSPVAAAPNQPATEEDQVARVEEKSGEEEGELVQQIELGKAQQIPAPRPQVKPATHPTPAPSVSVSPSKRPGHLETRGGSARARDKRADERSTEHAKANHASSNAQVKDKPVPVLPTVPAVGRSGGPNLGDVAEKTDGSKSGSVEKAADRRGEPAESARAEQHQDESIASRPKSKRNVAPKVIATVSNKSRVQIPNGYIYQFDLVLHEVSGLNVRWRSIASRKVSYSGKSVPVNSPAPEQDRPTCSARYHVVVKMLGSCIEDWYGQFVTISSGVDENGNPIELEHVLLLDDSFPNYSGDTYRLRSNMN